MLLTVVYHRVRFRATAGQQHMQIGRAAYAAAAWNGATASAFGASSWVVCAAARI